MKLLSEFKSNRGLTLLDVFILVALLAVVAMLLLPALARPRQHPGLQCVNKLKQIGLAFRIWAGDNNDKYPMQVSTNAGGTLELAESPEVFRHFQSLRNELGTPKVTVCREDDGRESALNFSNFNNANLSYFVGIDASETNANMLLTGDRHITNGFAPKDGMLNLMKNQNVRWSKELHDSKNNIGLADGSVQQVSSKEMRFKILPKTGFVTNKIFLP
jgi:hypothetical protein